MLAFILLATSSIWTGSATAPPDPPVWSGTANWNTGVAPNAVGDSASFSTGPSRTTLSLTSDVTLGTFTFDSALTYTIQDGSATFTLQATSGSAQITTSAAGTTTIAPKLVLASPLQITQGSTGALTLSGVISGAQTVTINGTSTVNFSATTNTYSGTTTLTSGTLGVIADGSLGGSTLTIGSATLRFNNGSSTSSTRAIILSGTSVIDTEGSPVTLGGILSGSGTMQKVGSGTLTLSATNTYSGMTSVGAGVLAITKDASLGAFSTLNLGATLSVAASPTISRPIVLSSASGISTGGANAPVFSGTISGSGTLTIGGGGTVTLTGTNTFLGNMVIDSGTMLELEYPIDTTYEGLFSGAGQITKSGDFVLTLVGTSTLSGTVNIAAGALYIEGALPAPVTVEAAAGFGGSGSVESVTNDGTLGLDIETLTITDFLTLGSTSIIDLDISPTSASLIDVAATATIDGELVLNITPGFYGFSATHTLITADSLSGTFATTNITASGFLATITYPSDTVLLTLEILEPFASFPFSNANTAAVGNNIDALYSANELSSALLAALDPMIGAPTDDINSALNQLQASSYSDLTESQADTAHQMLSLFHRLPVLCDTCSHDNRLWIDPFGALLTLQDRGANLGFRTKTGGIAAGFDRKFSNVTWGVGFAWNHTNYYQQTGKMFQNGYYGGTYLDFQRNAFYMGMSLLAGKDFYTTDRQLDFFTTNENARANFSALDIMAEWTAAYLFGSPYAYFYPFVTLDFIYQSFDSIEEAGATGLNLSTNSRSTETLRSNLGLALQVQDYNPQDTVCLSPKIALGWVNYAPLSRPGFTSTFEGTTIPFTTNGWDQSWNLFAIDVALKISSCSTSFSLRYTYETSADSNSTYSSQLGSADFSFTF